MSCLSFARDGTRVSFFVLIAGSKTLVGIGQACLTVDATVLAINCMAQYYQEEIQYEEGVYVANVIAQITAALFSTSIVVLTRFPAIWEKLTIKKLQQDYLALKKSIDQSTIKIKLLLILIGLFGLLSCISRGMSAYLGVEVLLGDRAKFHASVVAVFAWIAAIAVTLSSMCFNLSNMLTSAVRTLKNPDFSCRVSIIIPMISAMSNAAAIRFFILHFLTRRQTSLAGQVLGQSVFTLAELVLGLFTLVTSFNTEWKDNAKKALTHACLLTCFIIGDTLTTWLGYNTITWYSILTDVFLKSDNVTSHNISACATHASNVDFALRWTFLSVACVIGILATVAYIHYLLGYAKQGYDKVSGLLRKKPCCSRYGMFRDEESYVLQEVGDASTMPTNPPSQGL